MPVYSAGVRSSHSCSNCLGDILPGQEYRRVGKRKFHNRPGCENAQSIALTEPPPLLDECSVHFHNRSRTRLLRCYEGIAEVEHTCYLCAHSRYFSLNMLDEILPGDRYTAEVWIISGRLQVRFFHDTCPFNPDEEDESLKDGKKTRGDEDFYDWSLPLAA